MKESIREALLKALAVSTWTFVLSAMASAGPPSVTPKHPAKTAGAKKALAAPRSQSAAAANSMPTTLPGFDDLPLAQGRQAQADADAGQKALDAGDLGTAETDFRSATGLDASNSDALRGLAQTLEREGKGPQAIRVYRYLLYPKKWSTSLEEDEVLRMHFALLLQSDGQWPEAVYVYENTVAGGISLGTRFPALDVHFDPNVSEPALFRAMAHLVMGIHYSHSSEKDAKALTEYRTAVDLEPNLALANYYYGQGLLLLGRHVEANAAFAKAAGLTQGSVRQAAQKEIDREAAATGQVTQTNSPTASKAMQRIKKP